ncbi:MAG: CRTAC1 family protein [Verrucomicrobia bacterium]|nr:CRTAC1 family protein [Verrucomicrobiota bacterium]
MKPPARIAPIVLASFSLAPIAAPPVFAADPFQDVTDNVGLQGVGGGHAAWGDFDNDGSMDILNGGRLFRNPGGQNRWLKVRLSGRGKVNRSAFGSQVRIRLGDATLTRQVESATGQGNQNDLTLHFGLGTHAEDVDLEVRWPDGSRQRVKHVKANSVVRVAKE